MASVVWAAVKHSAKVIAATNALGFAVTAVTQVSGVSWVLGPSCASQPRTATDPALLSCGL